MKLFTRHSSLVMLLLLVAFFFRTHELAGLGLGLEHDEVAEWQIADGIRHGQHALFFQAAYGQEPLFLYLMAGSTALIGDNVIGVRFTAVFVAMLTLAASYRLLRRMFSPTVALVALAGLAIALWPVFWGRVALRAMTLPLLLCLAFDWLWRGLTKDEGGRRKDKGGRMKAEGGRMKAEERSVIFAFILHPSSFILHPSSFILHPSSLPVSSSACPLTLTFHRAPCRSCWRRSPCTSRSLPAIGCAAIGAACS